MILDRLKALFKNLSAEFRSTPFWAWNDKLDEKELIFQIKEMKKQGNGGFFMHSREGLETEYLSGEWFELIKKCVETAKEEGMEAWLYDEDRWPSGTAGGMVTSTGGDDSRCKGLTIEVCNKISLDYKTQVPEKTGIIRNIENKKDTKKVDNTEIRGSIKIIGGRESECSGMSEIIALFKAKVKGMEILECSRLQMDASNIFTLNTINALQTDEVYLVFRIEVSEPSEWFNNEAPPDNLNAKSVRRFINSTYEAYKEAVGMEFGKTVKGVFTDEPSLADRNSKFNPKRGWIPWTYSFVDYFREKRGYDILDYAPYIYFNCDKSSFVRHDYWRTVTELFSESYSKQISEWCTKNNICFTGHFLQEDKLGLATRVGGAVMPHYIYQHVPGIDMLTEKTDEYLTVRQCTSVANQYGKKKVITETYGCTGWDFTFEGQKWIGDWQFVMGVNRRCQHLALYSIKGCRKRDYPPVFNYNTSWWKFNKVVEDYFARLSAVLTEGQVIRDILVLHPSTSAWSMLGTDPYGNPKRSNERDVPNINNYGNEFNNILKYLMKVHYDYDLGDELLIEKDGAIKEVKFCVKYAAYKVVVIPPLKTILKSTFNLLLDFLNAGGIVIVIKPFAAMIEGRESAEINQLFAHKNLKKIQCYTELAAAIEKAIGRRVSIKNERGEEISELFCMLKEVEDFETLFVINNNRDKSFNAVIDLNEAGIENGIAEEWDPLTGKFHEAHFYICNGKLSIEAEFKAADSKLFIIRKVQSSISDAGKEKSFPTFDNTGNKPSDEIISGRQHQISLDSQSFYASMGQKCTFKRTLPNSLILDKCSYKIDHDLWSEEMEVWQAQKNIREILGMRQIYYNGLPQRYKWIKEQHPKNGTEIELRFNFKIEDLPSTETYVVIEDAESFSIRLNGQNCNNVKSGYFIDKSFDKILLKNLIKGYNELILSCNYTNKMELEDCYIIGDFAVNMDRAIIKEPHVLSLGDWCLQGYPYYAGSIIYKFDFQCHVEKKQKLLMEINDFSATVIDVKINERQAGFIPWKAKNILDITEFVAEDKNTAYVEVMGSMRNLLGPFHEAQGKTLVTDWSSFRTTGEEYTPDYNLKSYGIFQTINLYIL